MLPLAFGFGGPWDMAIIGGVLIVLFGGSKISGLGKSLGESIREFKKATNDDDKDAVTPVLPAASYPQEPRVITQEPRVISGVNTEEK
jgi:sec-independent protein translocase protein TatA